MSTSVKTIGQRIKDARKAVGMSQQDLGEKLFKTGAAIGYIERGERGINVEDLIAIAQALGQPVGYFFSGKISEAEKIQQTLSDLQKNIYDLDKSLKNKINSIEKLKKNLPRSEDLRLITEYSIDPILLISRSRKILYATKSIDHLIGYHIDDLLGRRIAKIVAPDQRESFEDYLDLLYREKKIRHYETIFLHQNGHLVNVEINAHIVLKKGQEFIHAVVRNITTRQQVVQALIQSESKYREIMRQSKNGMFLVNQNGEIIEWNHKMVQLTGLDLKKERSQAVKHIVNKIIFDQRELITLKEKVLPSVISWKNRDKYAQEKVNFLCKIRNNRQVLNLEFLLYPIYMKDQFLIGGIVHNVTQWIKINHQLEELKVKCQSFLENNLDAIIFFDQNYNIVNFNQLAQKLFKSIKISKNQSLWTIGDNFHPCVKSKKQDNLFKQMVKEVVKDLNSTQSTGPTARRDCCCYSQNNLQHVPLTMRFFKLIYHKEVLFGLIIQQSKFTQSLFNDQQRQHQ